MSSPEIWYFEPAFDRREHTKIQGLLDKVNRRLKIACRRIGSLGRLSQEDSYRQYFAAPDVARRLSERTGQRVEEQLKENSGAVYVRGIVAIAEDGSLQWYCTSDRACDFLNELLRGGPDFISRLYQQTKTYADFETMLIDAMEADQLIAGKYERAVYVGYALREEFPDIKLKVADAICTGCDSQVWAIEAEAELNHTAIGQATVYRYLYSRDNPAASVRPAIVCGSATEDMLAVCSDTGIEVFVIPLR